MYFRVYLVTPDIYTVHITHWSSTVVTTVYAGRIKYFLKRITVYCLVETILTSNVKFTINNQYCQFQSYLNDYSILLILAMSDKFMNFIANKKPRWVHTVFLHASRINPERFYFANTAQELVRNCIILSTLWAQAVEIYVKLALKKIA